MQNILVITQLILIDYKKGNIMNIKQFKEKYKKELSEGTISIELINDSLDYIAEKASSERESISSYIRNIYSHMLKYLYQPNKQTKSWIVTIVNNNADLVKAKEKYKSSFNDVINNQDKLNRIFNNSLESARKETRINIEYKDIYDKYFNIDYIMDYNKLMEFLDRFANTYEAKTYLSKIRGGK